MRILWIAPALVFSGLLYLSHSQVVAQQAAENEVSADAVNQEKLAVFATAAAPPSVLTQQTVDRNVGDRVRSQSSNPAETKSRALDKQC